MGTSQDITGGMNNPTTTRCSTTINVTTDVIMHHGTPYELSKEVLAQILNTITEGATFGDPTKTWTIPYKTQLPKSVEKQLACEETEVKKKETSNFTADYSMGMEEDQDPIVQTKDENTEKPQSEPIDEKRLEVIVTARRELVCLRHLPCLRVTFMARYDQDDADLTILVEAYATADSHHSHWMSSINGLQDILFLLTHKVKIIVNIIDTIAATVNEIVSMTSSGLNMATLQNPLDTPPYWYQQKTLTKRTGMRVSCQLYRKGWIRVSGSRYDVRTAYLSKLCTPATAAAESDRQMRKCTTSHELHTTLAPGWEHRLEERASGTETRARSSPVRHHTTTTALKNHDSTARRRSSLRGLRRTGTVE
jgi:hypothetical protein